MAAPNLTPGQRRVRELAASLVPRFVATAAHDERGFSGVCADLRARLRTDPVVREDPVTGADLRRKALARSYVRWVEDVSGPPATSGRQAGIRFDRLRLPRYEDVESGGAPRPAYSGGAKPDTTMRAILTIVAGGEVPEEAMGVTRYYARSGILRGSNGNHRLLAHALVGHPGIPNLERLEERIDPPSALNGALLTAEGVWPGRTFRLLGTSDEELASQAEEAIAFADDSDDCERRIIGDILLTYPADPSGELSRWQEKFRGNAESPVGALNYCLEELRTARARGPVASFLLRAKRRLGLADEPSDFEYWYELYTRERA